MTSKRKAGTSGTVTTDTDRSAEEDTTGRPSIVNRTRTLDLLEQSVAANKAMVTALCKKFGVSVEDTEQDVIVNFIEQEVLKDARVEKIPNPLTLDNAQVLLEPAFHILLWEAMGKSFLASSLKDDFGNDGPYILSLHRRLTQEYPEVNSQDMKSVVQQMSVLASNYLLLRNYSALDQEGAEATVKAFFINQRLALSSLRTGLREMHVSRIEKNFGSASASKFRASLGLLAPENNPVNSGFALKGALANMQVARGPQSPEGNGNRFVNKKRVRNDKGETQCHKCEAFVPAGGFKEHNKVCPKRKKKG